jgi:hypothetical protein
MLWVADDLGSDPRPLVAHVLYARALLSGASALSAVAAYGDLYQRLMAATRAAASAHASRFVT